MRLELSRPPTQGLGSGTTLSTYKLQSLHIEHIGYCTICENRASHPREISEIGTICCVLVLASTATASVHEAQLQVPFSTMTWRC